VPSNGSTRAGGTFAAIAGDGREKSESQSKGAGGL